MKTYAITIQNSGAVLVNAKSKKDAIVKFIEQGYTITSKDVYLY